MIINCFYDDCEEFADIIFIPDSIKNVEEIQEQFFKWMFDKKVKHKYWVIVDNEQRYCQYGTQAFVDWINDSLIKDSCEKSYMLEENATRWDESNACLIF